MNTPFHPEITPASRRILNRCRTLADQKPAEQVLGQLVLSLLLEESLAAACLVRFGVSCEAVAAGLLGQPLATTAKNWADQSSAEHSAGQSDPDSRAAQLTDSDTGPISEITDSEPLRRVLDRAAVIARRSPGSEGISSEHLLLAVTQSDDSVADRLAELGLTPTVVARHFDLGGQQPIEVIAVSEQLNLPSELSPAVSAVTAAAAGSDRNVLRLLDANLNRAREGLRVLEDFARFMLDHSAATVQLKTMRHRLVEAEQQLWSTTAATAGKLNHRDTPGDVGTRITTASELNRPQPVDIVIANARRVQEALRSLEEFGKSVSTAFAESMKQLRYEAYAAEQQLRSAVPQLKSAATVTTPSSAGSPRHQRLQQALVYVLLTEQACRRPWQQVAEDILDAGADVIQLREKQLNDRELLSRSRWLQSAASAAGSLFIVNDRVDLTALAAADGVHLGQDDPAIEDARRLLSADQLIGISTHHPQQATAAIAAGADYLGVGPIFPSATKSFDDFPGLNYLNQIATLTRVPGFAIGGITVDNLQQVIDAGGRRIAVSATVLSAESPGDVVRELRTRLQQAGSADDLSTAANAGLNATGLNTTASETTASNTTG